MLDPIFTHLPDPSDADADALIADLACLLREGLVCVEWPAFDVDDLPPPQFRLTARGQTEMTAGATIETGAASGPFRMVLEPETEDETLFPRSDQSSSSASVTTQRRAG